jgi:hypothetical protein
MQGLRFMAEFFFQSHHDPQHSLGNATLSITTFDTVMFILRVSIFMASFMLEPVL